MLKTNNDNNNDNNNNNNNNNNKSAWIRNSRWQLARDIQPLGSKVKMHPNNKMKTRSQNTYHIVRRVGKQGTRPPRESNQPGVEKCTTGLTASSEKHSDGDQAHGDLPACPSRVTPTTKKEKDKRQKWSREN